MKARFTRKSLGQQVFEHLKEAVICGEIAAGERLVETRIAEAFSMSRTPVREALHKLEREGLLEKIGWGGFRVAGLRREEVEETFGIRAVLESYAARLASEKHRNGDIMLLKKKAEAFGKAIEEGKMDDLPKINTDFHDMLFKMSRSPKLIEMIGGLRDRIHRYRILILKKTSLARKSHEDHLAMIRAIENRDGNGVESLVREHIMRGRDAVLSEFE